MNDRIIDTVTNIRQDADGLYRTTQQEIPDSFLSRLAEERNDNGITKSGEMMKMASIPVVVVEEMAKQGLDIYKAPIKDIIKWLKNNDMGHFITSDKRI